ncbi:MAG: hypothetical protein J6I80_04445, partial [Clostridia bacterium]|nr:hypothetical protein [Clostridia bacterium]
AAAGLTDGLDEVATVALNATKDNRFAADKIELTDITGGGIKLAYKANNNINANFTYSHNKDAGSIFGNTFTLQFNDYQTTSTQTANAGYKEFQVILGSSNGDYNIRLTGGVPAIRFDTKNGRLLFVKGTNNGCGAADIISVIATNDALKYENISGKAFTLKVSAKASWTKIEVEVAIAGSQTVSGVISKAAWNTEANVADGSNGSAGKLPTTKTYFSVGGTTSNEGSYQPFSIEYYGFKAEQNPGNEENPLIDYTYGLDEVATVALNVTPSKYMSQADLTDIDGGGILLSYKTRNDTNSKYNYAHNKNAGTLFGNAITLQFNDYKTTSTNSTKDGYQQFQVILGASADENHIRLTGGVPAIRFDTKNGKLLFVKGPNNNLNKAQEIQVIATDDALKYANFNGKPFTLTVSAQEAWTQIDVEVVIDGITTVTGAITKASWETEATIASGSEGSAGKLPTTATYFSVGGTTNGLRSYQPFSIEYYGFKVESLASGGQGGGNQGGGQGGNASIDLSDLTDIANASKNLETRVDVSYSATDIQGGGVKMEWTRMSAYYPYRYNVNMGAFPGNGIKMQFANYKINATNTNLAGYGQIAIVLSSTTAGDRSKVKQDIPFLQIDTVNGNLKLRHCLDGSFGATNGWADDQTIISNNNTLKYANLKEKPFSITITMADNDEDYKVEVDVAGTVVSGTILAEKLNAISWHPTATSTYMSVGGIDNNGNSWYGWSIEYYGYKAYPQTASPLLDGLTEIATSAKNVETRTDLSTIGDLYGGGIAVEWQRFSGYGPYRFSPNLGAFPGNGLMLQFANYKINTPDTTVNGYGQILIVLSKATTSDATKIKPGSPFLQIDTVNGKVDLRVCNDVSFGTKDGFTDLQTVIPANDTLKYENLRKKDFQVKFEMADNGVDYKLTIDVAGTALTGTILKEKLDTCANRPNDTATFISIGGIDNDSTNYNKWGIEFYGAKNYSVLMEDTIVKGDVDAVNAAIAALPANASLDKAADILLAKAKYDALGDKRGVTDAAKLTRLMQELNTLRQAAKHKPTSTYIARDPSYTTEFGNPEARTVFSSVTDNGFKAEWRGTKSSLLSLRSQAIEGAFKLDGLRVFIDNFTFDAAKSSDFWIHFTSGDYDETWDNTAAAAEKMIAVRMGMSEDKLEVNGLGMTASWYAGITSWMQRDNFAGKAMIVEWFKTSNGDYVCTITLNEEVLAFTVAKDKIAAMDNFDENCVRVIIGTQSGLNVFSMEVTGIDAQLDAAVVAMMDKIEALPKAVTSAADVTAIEKVYNEYLALAPAKAEQVLNKNVLTEKRALARKFEGVNDEGRDKDGYYIPNTTTDVYGDNESNSVYANIIESNMGGWHVDFNNGGYGIKNCFDQKFVIDGLSIRFDNFNYAHAGSFFIGFESSTAECKIFPKTASITKYGFWLLIGEDNTIYSTGAGKDWTEMIRLFEPNEKLSAQNLMNKEFFVSWDEHDDKTLTLTFTVDNTDFVYHFDAEHMEQMSYLNTEDLEIVIHNCTGMKPAIPEHKDIRQAVSVDITGVKYNKYSGTQMALIKEIIDAIDALPETASYEIEETIQTIRKMYFSLDFTELRLGVTNYDKVVKLQEALFDMHVADGTLYAKVEEESDDDYEDEDYD